jgi:hypothetical protein
MFIYVIPRRSADQLSLILLSRTAAEWLTLHADYPQRLWNEPLGLCICIRVRLSLFVWRLLRARPCCGHQLGQLRPCPTPHDVSVHIVIPFGLESPHQILDLRKATATSKLIGAFHRIGVTLHSSGPHRPYITDPFAYAGTVAFDYRPSKAGAIPSKRRNPRSPAARYELGTSSIYNARWRTAGLACAPSA